MAALLEIEGVEVLFRSAKALDEVSLVVQRGQIVGLIGPNGAGKTTLLNAVSGFVRASGSIVFAGRPLLRMPPDKRARLGIGRTFQKPQIFLEQTVREHLIVASDHAQNESLGALEVAELLEIDRFFDVPAGELPSHARMRLEIARAAIGQPGLLLLDEPASGLLPSEVEELHGLLRRVHARLDTAILIIDHNMELVLRLCDRVYVLDFGRLLFEGTPPEVRVSSAVIAAYLGKD